MSENQHIIDNTRHKIVDKKINIPLTIQETRQSTSKQAADTMLMSATPTKDKLDFGYG